MTTPQITAFAAKKKASMQENIRGKENNDAQKHSSPRSHMKRCSDEGLEVSPPKIHCKTSYNNPRVLLERLQLSPAHLKSLSSYTIEKPESNSDILSSAIRALHSTQPNLLPGRSDKIKEICLILEDCLKNHKSTTLYISGQPGTGKTACLNHIMNLKQFSKSYKIVYINCTGMKSAYDIFKRIVEQLGLISKTTNEKTLKNVILSYLMSSHKMILLVLDEMDQLESKRQSVLYSIFEWPSLPNADLVLIGLANALDLTDRVLPRLQARLELQPTLIHFAPYTKDEIVNIIYERLNEAGVGQVLEGTALHLLACKVAAVSGDIRRALDIARRVIELTQAKSNSTVTVKEVLSVVSNVYSTSKALTENKDENSDTFPLQQKLFICTTLLIRQHAKAKELYIGKMHDVYKKVCAKRNLGTLDLSEFLNLADLVESRGVIKLHGKTKNRLSKVSLQWDESEISNALKDKQLLSDVVNDVSCLSKNSQD